MKYYYSEWKPITQFPYHKNCDVQTADKFLFEKNCLLAESKVEKEFECGIKLKKKKRNVEIAQVY